MRVTCLWETTCANERLWPPGVEITARSATEGLKLVAFLFGYVYEFGALPTGTSNSGHYALRKVLNCPDMDVLCSPIS